MTRHVVEVNEATVYAASQGVDWWSWFRLRFVTCRRIEDVTVSLGGNLCHVAADSRADADWLAARMVECGLPKSAVKVKRVAS